MSERQFFLRDDGAAKATMAIVMDTIRQVFSTGLGVKLVVKELKPQRTLDQNARMWAMLTDISQQVIWYGEKPDTEDWKNLFTAVLKKQRTLPGIDGGFVVLGTKTSGMDIKLMSELIELMFSFGADHNVKWTDPKLMQNHQ